MDSKVVLFAVVMALEWIPGNLAVNYLVIDFPTLVLAKFVHDPHYFSLGIGKKLYIYDFTKYPSFIRVFAVYEFIFFNAVIIY